MLFKTECDMILKYTYNCINIVVATKYIQRGYLLLMTGFGSVGMAYGQGLEACLISSQRPLLGG
jgi:hypothetical protein